MDDIEAMASMHGLSREQLRFYPESHGGSVAGQLTVVDRNSATGQRVEIDCTNLGSGAYSIPRSVEHLNFRTDARFVLAIEPAACFSASTIIGFGRMRIALSSKWRVPTRATGVSFAFFRQQDCPVYCFVDCDRMVSQISTVHSKWVQAMPLTSIAPMRTRARFLGVTPQDISTLVSRMRPPTGSDRRQRAQDALQTNRSSRPIPHGSPPSRIA